MLPRAGLSQKLLGWPKGYGAGHRSHTAGAQSFPKGLLIAVVPWNVHQCHWGKMNSVLYQFGHCFGETNFLTLGHLRAFKVYHMMPQEGDVLFRLTWPWNAFIEYLDLMSQETPV